MSYTRNRSAAAMNIAEINITPLVDVLLTVLIIFMVTTPLVTHRIDLPLGHSDQGAEQPKPTVFDLAIRDTGEFVLDGRSTNRAALEVSLSAAVAQGLPLQLEIRPEAHSSYDNLAIVLAIAQRNGVNDLRVLGARRDN